MILKIGVFKIQMAARDYNTFFQQGKKGIIPNIANVSRFI
jgi:hypothetical protein